MPLTLDEFHDRTLANKGSVIIADTTKTDGEFCGFTVINDAVLAAISAPRLDNAADLEGLTLPAGLTVLGQINSLTLTSGVIQAFKR